MRWIKYTDGAQYLVADWLAPGEIVWLHGRILTVQITPRNRKILAAGYGVDVNDDAELRRVVEGCRT